MPALTNNTFHPIGIAGLLGSIEPGQTRDIHAKVWDAAKGKPAVAYWVQTGGLTVIEDPRPKKAKVEVTE